jgi:hypothetical protein
MPSPEHLGDEGAAEQERPPYAQAARFPGERPAGQAYFQAQAAIHQAECDLSAYRLKLDQVWHVAVVGQAPPEGLHAQLGAILAAGEPADLPPDIARFLHVRRVQAGKLGPCQVAAENAPPVRRLRN